MRISDWSSDVCSSDLLALIVDYLKHTPDPDRGWAIAALTESLDFPAVKSAMVRALLATRVDEELFRLSRHFVGDTAETAALLWPEPNKGTGPTRFAERRSEEHTSELQSLMRISYAVFCLKKK